MKSLFAAAEIIPRFHQGKGFPFLNLINFIVNQFYCEYIKDNSNRLTPRLEQSDDYLYRWAETVWLRTLDELQKQSRQKYFSVLLSKIKLC